MRLLVVDDKGLMREGLCALIEGMHDVEIVGCAPLSQEAVRRAAELHPDVVLLEFPEALPLGPKLIASLKARAAGVRVVVLMSHKEDFLVESALQAGANAYMLTSDSREDLFSALRSAASGRRFISPSLDGRAFETDMSPRTGEVNLTERERQVIRLIASGHRTREIAQALSLSHKTIEKHRSSLMRKLGVRNATAVAVYAIAHGFADE